MAHVLSDGVAYYRLVLPVELSPARFEQPGTWHAVLRIGRQRDPREGDEREDYQRNRIVEYARFLGSRPSAENQALAAAGSSAHGLPFSLVVHSYSNLSFRASLDQSGFEPGSTLRVHVVARRTRSSEKGRLCRPFSWLRGLSSYPETNPKMF